MDEPELKQRYMFLQWKHLLDQIDSLQTRFKELHDRFYSERSSLRARQREVEELEKGLESKVLNFHSEMEAKVLNFLSEMESNVLNFHSEMESRVLNFLSEMESKYRELLEIQILVKENRREVIGKEKWLLKIKERGKDPPKISLDIHGTTIIVAITINTVYMASDSRTIATLNDTETMTCRETKKVRLILKEPPVLVAHAGDLKHAVEVIDELQQVAQLPGHFKMERLVDRARRFTVRKNSRKNFEIFICAAGKGRYMIFYPKFQHLKDCQNRDCYCPWKSEMECFEMDKGLFSMGSGGRTALHFFENKYHRRGTELGYGHILANFIIGPHTQQDMFQALFEAGIQSGGSTGPPYRVDTIINGQVDYHQLNFIPLYQGHSGIREQSENGYNLFVLYPTILEGFNRGHVIYKDSPICFDKVLNRGFRLATIKGDTGPYVLQLIKFLMNNYDEKPYALQALESSPRRTFRGRKKLRSYDLVVNLGTQVWKKDLDVRHCNKQWMGVIRAPIFIGKPSLQFFSDLEEVYDFKSEEPPKHVYSGLREMLYDFCGSTTGNAGGSHVSGPKNWQYEIEQSHDDLNGMDSCCPITDDARKAVKFFSDVTKSTEKVKISLVDETGIEKPPTHVYSGLRDMLYDFCGSTTSNSGGSHVSGPKNWQYGIEQSQDDLNSMDSCCPITDDARKAVKFFSDITKSTEKVKISLVDETGNEGLPNFNYIPHNIIYKNANVNISLARISDEDCCTDCCGDCLSASTPCACARETGGEFVYTPQGMLREDFLAACVQELEPEAHNIVYCQDCPIERSEYPEKCKGHRIRKFVKECWRKCGCDLSCGNRVVQRGISCKLQVFVTPERKGWGVRTLEVLQKGTFVCEYVGEILTNTELCERNNQSSGAKRRTYPVLLDGDWGSEQILKDDGALFVDATFHGNVARFIKHSSRCSDANLIDIPVQVETPDRHYYHLALFTTRKVNAFEELTWDYGIDFDGSVGCRGKKQNGWKSNIACP